MSRKSSRYRPGKNKNVAKVAAVAGQHRLFGRRGIILITIIFCVSAVCGMAEWKAKALTSLPAAIGRKTGYLASPTPTAPKLTKEYIYSNGSTVATVEPDTGAASMSGPVLNSVRATSATQILISYGHSTGPVENYQLERSTNISSPFVPVATITNLDANFYTDIVSSNCAYLYRIKAISTSGASSVPSGVRMATVWNYLDDPLAPGMFIKAQHIKDLRDATNVARVAVGLSPFSWLESVESGVVTKAQHTAELKGAFTEVWIALGIPLPHGGGTPVRAGDPIRASDITGLRDSLGGKPPSSGVIPH